MAAAKRNRQFCVLYAEHGAALAVEGWSSEFRQVSIQAVYADEVVVSREYLTRMEYFNHRSAC